MLRKPRLPRTGFAQALRAFLIEATAKKPLSDSQLRYLNGLRKDKLSCMKDAPADLTTLTMAEASQLISTGTQERADKKENTPSKRKAGE
jgi:carbohydrate-selective porin OprB